jgi:RecA/RadA recombinase
MSEISQRDSYKVGLVAVARVVQTRDPAALDLLLRRVTVEHFEDQTTAQLVELLERYSMLTGSVIGAEELRDLAHRAGGVGGAARLVAVYDEALSLGNPEGVRHDQFVFALDELRVRRAQWRTREALTTAAEMLRADGVTIDRTQYVGHADARSWLLEQLTHIDAEQQRHDAPEGDVWTEGEEFVAEYVAAKTMRAQGRAPGVLTGLTALDRVLGSIDAGELGLIIGWTSDGKTTLCVNLAWHAAVVQRKNVFFATTETLRPTVRRRLYCRHSALPEWDLAEPLDSAEVKRGTLSPDHEGVLRRVADDLVEGGRSGRYGKLHVAQVPKGANITQLEGQARRYHSRHPIDLMVIDYLGLLAPERRRREARDELTETLKAAKNMAATFGDGEGIPILSPWQVSRNAREAAERTGRYTLASLSDTAEAEKSSDLILGLFRRAPEGGNYPRHDDVSLQVLKNRDGSRADDIMARVDYASCTFSDAGFRRGTADTRVSDADFGWGSDSVSEELDALLDLG